MEEGEERGAAANLMAAFSKLVSLLFLLVLALVIPTAQSKDQFSLFFDNCNTDANYTANSTFHANLNLLLPTLASAAAPSGFSNDTVGLSSPDQAFGLALCRGDVSASDCRACLNASVSGATAQCPRGVSSTIWYDDCMLRYSNASFLSVADISPKYYAWNPENATDPQRFKSQRDQLMETLAQKAAFGSSTLFAAGSVNFTSYLTIYGLAQCTRDLSSSACYMCLHEFVGLIPTCCDWKQGGKVYGTSCYLRFEIAPFYNVSAVQNAAAPPSPASSHESPPSAGKNSTTVPAGVSNGTKRTKIVIIISVVAGLGLLAPLLVLYLCLKRRKTATTNVIPKNADEQEMNGPDFLAFDLSILKAATNNFSAENKLGEGGFGPVYKGVLQNGQEIAVKRLSRGSDQGMVQLRNEVVLVAKLQHKNLVRVMGFCLEEQEKILVYEFLSNASLDKILFDSTRSHVLDWQRRRRIIEGIGRGLLYLHEDSRLKIIHRDLKASNILLDGDMNPKISDFGLARLFDVDVTQGNTSRIVGTYGYMAPEYAFHGLLSAKSDVFSYGVLVLEIVTGRRNFCVQESESTEDVLTNVWRHWNERRALEVLDRCLVDQCNPHDVLRCIHIGLLCVQDEPSERPNMASVILMLNSPSTSLPAPSAPAFLIRSYNIDSALNSVQRNANVEPCRGMPRAASIADTSISEMEPR